MELQNTTTENLSCEEIMTIKTIDNIENMVTHANIMKMYANHHVHDLEMELFDTIQYVKGLEESLNEIGQIAEEGTDFSGYEYPPNERAMYAQQGRDIIKDVAAYKINMFCIKMVILLKNNK